MAILICPHCGSAKHRIIAASLTRIVGVLRQKVSATCRNCNRGYSFSTLARSRAELAREGVVFH